nr:ribonuclease H-like domain-containing protein [Tanacetum cinerariifolium]
MEDMCLLVKEDARLQAKEPLKPVNLNSKCIMLGRNFKLLDDANILLRTPRASADECIIWHRRLGHLNVKTMNKLVRHNLVRGLPTKSFDNDHTCTACLKGKQHKASCKYKLVNSMTKPLHMLHMDLFGLTSVSSISHKWYCLVVTDDFSRTMLADAKLPVTFWAEAVNTACYVQNRVLVNKSQNKTLYELFNGRTPAIGFLKPFGYHVMILNTLDNLRKFEAKGDEGYFIGYSMSSKAFRVFNKRTRRVEENLHVEFLENKAIKKGAGPNWLFDIDSLTKSMNYIPVDVGINSTNFSGTKVAANQEVKKDVSSLRYIVLPNWAHDALLETSSSQPHDESNTKVPEGSGNPNPTVSSSNPPADQIETLTVESPIPTVSSPVSTTCLNDSPKPFSEARIISKRVTNQEETPSLDNILSLTNRRVEENLHVEFLENKAIEKGVGPNWSFDINSLTKSMNYVPVDACTNSTNFSGTKDAASQEVKKDVSSLRYIALPNWVHDALLESSSKPSSDARLISKRVANQEETPSLDNILSLTNRFEDILGVTTSSDEAIRVEADVSNMEITISASPTPTFRIHKDHPKSQIIGYVDTPIQTKHKSKEVEEQSFIATIY